MRIPRTFVTFSQHERNEMDPDRINRRINDKSKTPEKPTKSVPAKRRPRTLADDEAISSAMASRGK